MRCILILCLLSVLSIVSRAEAPAAMLALRAPADVDPAPYWVSEKLDGVRALWDGRALRFRSGREIAVPDGFLAALPAQPLDGELWLGRGRFDELSGIVRREQPDPAAWRAVRYMVFDLPGAPGAFSERLARMTQIVGKAGVDWLQVVPQSRLTDRVALRRLFDDVVAGGGEGLMLHRADAHWTAGRSDALLKLTPWLDAEATVLGHLPGRGRHRGRLGALDVRTSDGRRFRIGSGFSDAQRVGPPPVGAEVTYRYRELTRGGLPRFPVFLRVRDLP
jgi:DNA ligase-1